MKYLLVSILTIVFPLGTYAQQLQESPVVEASLSDFANLHPLIVHVPIMLLIVAVATQIGSLFIWKKPLDWVTFLALTGGVAGAVMAGVVFHPHTTGLTPAAQQVLEQHDSYAYWTMWLSAAALVLKGISMWLLQDKRWLEIVTTLILAGSAVTVSLAAHYGGTLVYIHGVGVQGNYVEGDSNHEN
ncbi:putative membrane protein [Lewinella aquimaris]|uniref:Putative membrane protein n=1 Tax=Neolewinella aquimaris TaxID=1835722 RepID=A0A840EBM9_9BACT|nr:DUF2231 domain-containing protein [Neolewinella aquimaris]MBB4079408.1 putative membrane protein [Neolewinella aquimaris]